MQAQRLLRLASSEQSLCVFIRWRGLKPTSNTEKRSQKVIEVVPDLIHKVLARKSTPIELVTKVHCALGLLNGEYSLLFKQLDGQVLDTHCEPKI